MGREILPHGVEGVLLDSLYELKPTKDFMESIFRISLYGEAASYGTGLRWERRRARVNTRHTVKKDGERAVKATFTPSRRVHFSFASAGSSIQHLKLSIESQVLLENSLVSANDGNDRPHRRCGLLPNV